MPPRWYHDKTFSCKSCFDKEDLSKTLRSMSKMERIKIQNYFASNPTQTDYSDYCQDCLRYQINPIENDTLESLIINVDRADKRTSKITIPKNKSITKNIPSTSLKRNRSPSPPEMYAHDDQNTKKLKSIIIKPAEPTTSTSTLAKFKIPKKSNFPDSTSHHGRTNFPKRHSNYDQSTSTSYGLSASSYVNVHCKKYQKYSKNKNYTKQRNCTTQTDPIWTFNYDTLKNIHVHRLKPELQELLALIPPEFQTLHKTNLQMYKIFHLFFSADHNPVQAYILFKLLFDKLRLHLQQYATKSPTNFFTEFEDWAKSQTTKQKRYK